MPVMAGVEGPLGHIPIRTVPCTDVRKGNPQGAGTELAHFPILAVGHSSYVEVPSLEVYSPFCGVLTSGTVVPKLGPGDLQPNLVGEVFKMIPPELEAPRTNEDSIICCRVIP
jgi:hypothetical protein